MHPPLAVYDGSAVWLIGSTLLLKPFAFTPAGGEELRVNVQRKSRTHTPPNIDNAPNRIAGQLLFLGHAREFVKWTLHCPSKRQRSLLDR